MKFGGVGDVLMEWRL